MRAERLPALGPRGEGWFAIQVVLLAAIFLAGFVSPVLTGWAFLAGEAVGLALVSCGGLLSSLAQSGNILTT